MIPNRFGRVAGLCAVLAMTCTAGARAAGTPAEERLKAQELVRSDSHYVLEDETLVASKLYEARTGWEAFCVTYHRLLAFEEAEQQVRSLEQQRIQMRLRIDNLNVQMGQFPVRYHRNSVQWGAFNELKANRDALQLSINEVNSRRDTLNNQMPTFREKEGIRNEVKKRRGPLLESLGQLRDLVDATREKYDELARDDDVKQALTTLSRTSKVNLKLGPSADFLAAVKELEKAERLLQPGPVKPSNTPASKASPSRKPRR